MSDEDAAQGRTVNRRLVAVGIALTLLTLAGIALAITGTVPVDNGVTLQAPDGMTATLEGSTDAHLEEPFPTSGTVQWTTEAGNVSFFSSGAANATIHTSNITGTYTNVTGIDADPNSITIDPEDKDSAVVAQEIDTFAWRSGIAADDGTVDFAYSASATGEVTVQGLAADTRVAAIDADTDTILDDATTTGAGAVTFDSLDSGDHDVKIETFTPSAPTLSNASPTGEVSSTPTQVSVDVNDADFPRGDSVQVTIDLDGSQIHSETITSNQTVTASIPSSGQDGGSHSWSVDASDDYGESASDSYSYSIPQTLRILDEETTALIDDRQVNLTIYPRDDSANILNESTSNGTVDLRSGFPADEPFVVVAQSDGYLDRRIYVDSIYETQQIFMLNESTQHTDVIFRIEDYSGSYPPDDTVLEVQRGINGSWQTVVGDYFGANDQFESQLKYNERHRLVLRNAETGDMRILGSYTPLTSGTETLTISPRGELQLPDTHPTFEFSPNARTVPGNNSVNITAAIDNGTLAFNSWSVAMYNVDTGTNDTLFTDSSNSATGGSVSPNLDLSGREGRVKVVISYELEDGTTGTQLAYYNILGEPSTSMTLLDGIAATVGLVPNSDADTVLTLTAMIITIVGTAGVGSVFRMSTEAMGMVTLALVTVFSLLGWVGYQLLFTLLVLFASIVFIRRRW